MKCSVIYALSQPHGLQKGRFVYVPQTIKYTKWKVDESNTSIQILQILQGVPNTRANTAQTHGPPCSVYIPFLLHNACRTCRSSPTAVPGLRPAWNIFVLVCSMKQSVSEPTGWPHDHGPTNIGAMVKSILLLVSLTSKGSLFFGTPCTRLKRSRNYLTQNLFTKEIQRRKQEADLSPVRALKPMYLLNPEINLLWAVLF